MANEDDIGSLTLRVLEKIQAQLVTLTGEVVGVKTEVSSLGVRFTAVENAVKDNTARLERMDGRLDRMGSELASVAQESRIQRMVTERILGRMEAVGDLVHRNEHEQLVQRVVALEAASRG
jgi:hypothetical protein